MAEPFESVPDIEFAPKDPTAITEGIIGGFEAAWYQETGEVLQLRRPDARRMFLENVAQIVIHQRLAIDYAGKMNLLKYMRREYLDGWGGNWGERGYRLPASRALTTLRFSVPAPLNFTVVIPIGTQVAATGSLTLAFETTRVATLPMWQASVDVPAQCTETGPLGNDFAPGTVNRLINFSVPFAINVANTTRTAGGAERQEDEEYRKKLWALPESLSIAGPSGAYEWWARQANSAIIDVAIHSAPEIAGEVWAFPLLQGGLIPSDEILEQVDEILSAVTMRPVADYVTVKKPDEVEFDIDLDWFANEENATILDSVTAEVLSSINDFVLWTKSRISRDIIPSELHRRILNAGAKRVNIREPDYRKSAYSEVAIARSIRINFGGLEPVL
jgi:phage-related baseplate assembly protein